jgi:hypothetical protein
VILWPCCIMMTMCLLRFCCVFIFRYLNVREDILEFLLKRGANPNIGNNRHACCAHIFYFINSYF